MTHTVRVALAGLGAVNRSLLKLLTKKQSVLEEQYAISFQVTVVADSSGAAYSATGFDTQQLCEWKIAGGRVSELAEHHMSASNLYDFLQPTHCDLLFEGTPVDLRHGEPGLSLTRQALSQGISVVLANKGPLVHSFRALKGIASAHNAGLAYSATVCGALPVLNILQRDLIAADISKLMGIFNSTTNYILEQMRQGNSFSAALAEAQARGIAEADPTLDIEGWDTANKLTIIMNHLFGINVQLSDIEVKGIRGITNEEMKAVAARGHVLKLIASAERISSGYLLSVAPTAVPETAFLGQCNGWEMGIEFETDIYGTLYHKSKEESTIPTAAAMLRDAVNLNTSSIYR